MSSDHRMATPLDSLEPVRHGQIITIEAKIRRGEPFYPQHLWFPRDLEHFSVESLLIGGQGILPVGPLPIDTFKLQTSVSFWGVVDRSGETVEVRLVNNAPQAQRVLGAL
jgi:hypothetical protein